MSFATSIQGSPNIKLNKKRKQRGGVIHGTCPFGRSISNMNHGVRRGRRIYCRNLPLHPGRSVYDLNPFVVAALQGMLRIPPLVQDTPPMPLVLNKSVKRHCIES